MIEHFIDRKGTFFEPEGSNTVIPWASRDELITSYRSLLDEFGGTLEDAGDKADQNYVDVVNTTDHVVDATKQQEVKSVLPNPAKVDIPAPVTSSHAIPRPQTSTQPIPEPGNVQWPGPMTQPISISPASSQGFPNPFAAAVNKKEPKAPASMQGPDTGMAEVKADPAVARAIISKEKFAHLLEGVNHVVIRNFVLAEGTNTGTGKPTLIIYTLENIWLEFAFPYEEGLRILTKYPQRDPELIEFMKSSGHNE